MKINVSGRLYDIAAYEVDRESSLIDMDEVARIARERRPKLLLAGWSAYPRQLDFARFREIADEVGALLMVDMAHFAGLVAAGPAPQPDRVRRRRGHHDHPQDARRPARGGDPVQAGARQEDRLGRVPRPAGRPAGARDRGQGGRLQDRRQRAVRRAPAAHGRRAPARSPTSCSEAGHGVNVLTGGTDVHLVLVDLRDAEPELTGKQAEDRLHEIQITVNRNAVPFDPRPPMEASGLRIGTPALATRGLQQEDFVEVGRILAVALTPEYESRAGELAERVAAIVERYPLYEGLAALADAGAAERSRRRRGMRRAAAALADLRRLRCFAGADGASDRARRALRLPGRRGP